MKKKIVAVLPEVMSATPGALQTKMQELVLSGEITNTIVLDFTPLHLMSKFQKALIFAADNDRAGLKHCIQSEIIGFINQFLNTLSIKQKKVSEELVPDIDFFLDLLNKEKMEVDSILQKRVSSIKRKMIVEILPSVRTCFLDDVYDSRAPVSGIFTKEDESDFLDVSETVNFFQELKDLLNNAQGIFISLDPSHFRKHIRIPKNEHLETLTIPTMSLLIGTAMDAYEVHLLSRFISSKAVSDNQEATKTILRSAGFSDMRLPAIVPHYLGEKISKQAK